MKQAQNSTSHRRPPSAARRPPEVTTTTQEASLPRSVDRVPFLDWRNADALEVLDRGHVPLLAPEEDPGRAVPNLRLGIFVQGRSLSDIDRGAGLDEKIVNLLVLVER